MSKIVGNRNNHKAVQRKAVTPVKVDITQNSVSYDFGIDENYPYRCSGSGFGGDNAYYIKNNAEDVESYHLRYSHVRKKKN